MVFSARQRLIIDVSLSQSESLDISTMCGIALFMTCSVWQFHAHSILASLRSSKIKPTYKTPPCSSLLFRLFLTPHYTTEILIYLAMALLSRNWTLLTASIWTITKLAVTSGETREWARKKFKGEEWGRWNLIPFLY